MNDEYLLTGKLFCGKCGSPMAAQTGTGKSGKKFNYYSCNRKRYDHACNKKNEPQYPLEKFVIEAVRAEVMDKQVVDWIVDGYKKAITIIRNDSKKEMLQQELDAVNAEIENFLKAIGAGIFNDLTQARMEELQESRKDIEKAIRLVDLSERLPEPEYVTKWLYSIQEGDWTDRAFLKEVIRTFVRAVYVFDDKITIQYDYDKEVDIENAGLSGNLDGENSAGDVFTKNPERGTKKEGRSADRPSFLAYQGV